MSRVHLICGPVGAGKTTFSRALERERAALRLSIDEWMLRLFGEHMPRDVFHERSKACMDLIYGVAERSVALGSEVVLDCGYWRREHREYAHERLLSIPHELYYLETAPEERWRRLEARNAALPDGCYEITREMFEMFETCFEVPAAPEPFKLVRAEKVAAPP
jgi:predicted kinase